MPHLAIRGDGLTDATALARTLAELPDRAPVVAMIHGYGHDPSDPGSDPHLRILALRPGRRWRGAVSWPRRLGLVGGEGLGVAWGWPTRGTIRAANAQAEAQAMRLAGFVGMVRAIDRRRPVHLIARSLGARVATAALDDLGPALSRSPQSSRTRDRPPGGSRGSGPWPSLREPRPCVDPHHDGSMTLRAAVRGLAQS